jgi:acyl-CoA-binding protein
MTLPRAYDTLAADYHTQEPGGNVSDLQKQFETAAADSKKLDERPDNETLLKIYALYKQGSAGDVAGSRPGFGDMIGRAKHDAWAKLKGLSRDDAMRQYVALINSLKG